MRKGTIVGNARLIFEADARTASLAWDPLGQLCRRAAGTAGTLRSVYDGDEMIAEYNASGTLLRRHVHGTGADDPIVWYEGAGGDQRRSLFTDHQGSIVAVADAAGNKWAINSYDPWGIPGTGNAGRFQYTGQAWIPELGMYHYKARIYSPTLGRFLQADPVGYKDQMNLYAYARNDPVNNVDPTGTTCTRVGEQRGGAPQYECQIDSVAIVVRGRVMDARRPTQAENKNFERFNARYTAAVNNLARNPDSKPR